MACYFSLLKFFKKLDGLEENHLNYSSKYLFSLVNLGKFNEAFNYSKKLEKRKLGNFESDLIIGVYYLKNKNYDLAQKYFLKLKNRKSNSILNNFVSNVLLNWVSLKSLDLNVEEPYVKIKQIDQNSSFIAKKTKMFEEEKKVANKAPVDKITVNDLNQSSKKKTNTNSQKFNYFIKIADFYFIDSAKIMRNRIINESTIKNVYIRELSKNKFRVILGPYLDLKSLQKEYNKLDKFNFENIEIIKNV